MSAEGMGRCLAVEGATTRAVFEVYLGQVLVPTLRPGQVVVMDNLSAHKGGRVREILEEAGCELVYLPPYSPDLNPIEQAFSKVKGLLRQAEARTREALGGGDGAGALRGHHARGVRLPQPLRLPRPGPTTMTDALARPDGLEAAGVGAGADHIYEEGSPSHHSSS